MSLRKIAGLLAASGLVVGLLGTGVGAQFADSVTGTQNISVGTFSCAISDATAGASYGTYDAAGHPHSVTYNSPQITSSAAGNAPFTFTVKNWGSIDQSLAVTAGALTGTLAPSKFSVMALAPASPVALASGATQPFTTGIQWTALGNTDLGTSGSVTWTVNCGEVPPPTVSFSSFGGYTGWTANPGFNWYDTITLTGFPTGQVTALSYQFGVGAPIVLEPGGAWIGYNPGSPPWFTNSSGYFTLSFPENCFDQTAYQTTNQTVTVSATVGATTVTNTSAGILVCGS